MLLRPGNAGPDTFADHKQVLAAAIRQVPARFRRKILVRVDGAGASHELISHLLGMASPRRTVLFTCGWMITAADEDAIGQVPAGAWEPGIGQDGTIEQDKDVAEITHLMTRAGNWPDGLRWIARPVKPSRRHLKNLTSYEKKTGWKYSITCTNIPGTGIGGVPGSHYPQYIDAVHREPVRSVRSLTPSTPTSRSSDATGSAASSTNTPRSHEVTEFRAPTRRPRLADPATSWQPGSIAALPDTRVIHSEFRTSLSANCSCWRAPPMPACSTSVSTMLTMAAPSSTDGSPAAVTDGGTGAGMRRASSRRCGAGSG
jgi:hypothetical protein